MVVRSYELLSVERTDHVATITLNRPEKLNALNPPLVAEFHAALDEIASEEDIRVVIVTGAGRGFCSGADVNRQLESLQGTADPAPEGPGITALAPHLQRIPQPVIAAINGVSAGAGFGVALASVTSASPLKQPGSPASSSSARWSRIRAPHLRCFGCLARGSPWKWPLPAASTTRSGRWRRGL